MLIDFKATDKLTNYPTRLHTLASIEILTSNKSDILLQIMFGTSSLLWRERFSIGIRSGFLPLGPLSVKIK